MTITRPDTLAAGTSSYALSSDRLPIGRDYPTQCIGANKEKQYYLALADHKQVDP